MHPWNSRGHFQFPGGCDAADAHGRAVVVVSPEPLRGVILGLLHAFDDVLIQPFVPDRSIVALDAGVLPGLIGLDMLDGNPMFFSPLHQLFTDVFRAVVNPNGAWLAAPFNNPIKAPDDSFGEQREIRFDPRPFAIEVVQHVRQLKSTTIAQSIGHEIHRPGHVRRFRHRQSVRFVALQPLAGLDTQVQLKLAVNAIDAFVIPGMPLHVAQVQKTQPETPGFAGVGQTGQRSAISSFSARNVGPLR